MPNVDVPAGDIGVGGREIGFMFGQYKKLTRKFEGVLTGKGLNWGGSLIRPEATGYGQVYFAEEMLKTRGESLKGKRCLVSGSGNVAQYATEKVIQLGGKVLTFSDSSGFIIDEEGIDENKLAFVMQLKNVKRGRIKEYADKYPKATYKAVEPNAKCNPLWQVKCDVALPGATQNEINVEDANNLVKNGCYCVSEGSNMPTTPDGVNVFLEAKILYGPGKAANAGGVAVSGLEMSQNSMRLGWKPRRSGQQAHRHHEEHPPGLRTDRRDLRHPRKLRQRCQHRRLPEGGRRHDGPGYRLNQSIPGN